MAAESPAMLSNSAAFCREESKNSLFRIHNLNQALKQTPQRLFKSFLARNELVDSPSA